MHEYFKMELPANCTLLPDSTVVRNHFRFQHHLMTRRCEQLVSSETLVALTLFQTVDKSKTFYRFHLSLHP